MCTARRPPAVRPSLWSRATSIACGFIRSGRPWVVALMGSSLSPEQENALLERFDRIALLLGGDTAGRAASRAIAARLSGRCLVAVVQVPAGAQPDQLSSTAIQQLLKPDDV